MKKLLWLLVIGGALFAQTNLVQNPGFESWSGGLPDNWQKESGVNVYQENTTVHGGNYSVKLEATGSSNRGIYQTVTGITEGTEYTISMWVYSVNGTGSNGIGIYLTWKDNGGNTVGANGPYYNQQTNQWEEVSRSITAPSNATQLLIKIRAYANSTVAGFVDDVSVIPPSTNQPPTISNIQQTPTNPTSSDNVTITADITDPDGDNIAKDSLYYRVFHNGSWGDWTPVASSKITKTYSIPAQSNHDTVQYYIIAEDDQGARTESNTYDYYVSDDPVISNVSHTPTTPNSSEEVTVTADITDPNNDLSTDSLYYSTDGGSNWTAVFRDSIGQNSDTHYYTIPNEPEGTTVQYYVIARDAEGNRSESSTSSYTVSNVLMPVITEIMYNPATSWANDDHCEWVEIYNPNGSSFDIGGWSLTDGEATFTIPSNISIPPYGFLVIANDTDTVRSLYTEFLGDGNDSLIGNFTLILSNSSDEVVLLNPSGSVIDTVNYDDGSPWPTGPDGGGYSLALSNPELDNNEASNWCQDSASGTPGAANICGNVVLNASLENWTNNLPDHWQVESGASMSQDNTHRHRGSSSGNLSVTTDGAGIYQNIEQVTPGKPYHLHVWVNALGSVNSHPSIGVVLKYYNGNWNYLGEDGPFYPNSTGQWDVIAHRGTINANATKMKIYIIGYSTTKGNAGYVDDVNFVSEGATATGVSETHPAIINPKLRIITSAKRVKFLVPLNQQVELNIYDATGRKIVERNFVHEITFLSHEFTSGVYFAIIRSGDKRIANGKFVILR